MKRSILALAVSAALGVAGAAQAASLVNINPDAAGVDPTIAVGSLDWAVGNALITPVVSASGTVAIPTAGDVFQVYAHGRLGSFLDGGGNPIGGVNLNGATPATNYEWTFVTGFRELVTGAGAVGPGGTVNLLSAPGGVNFFEIWYDPNIGTGAGGTAGNNLAGTNFNNGTLILSGTVNTGGPANFTRNVAAANPGGVGNNLDQFGVDNYAAIDSINGGGDMSVVIDVTSYDSSFFTDPITTLLLDFTSQQRLAFNQQNPSALFVGGPGGIAPAVAGATVASVGTCNGCAPPFDPVVGGPNEVLQVDASSAFNAVPEPATLALMGLGLVGLGFSGRRRTSV